MSTTDTILASLTEQVRQLQAAIDWLDDHRATVDQCQHASMYPFATQVFIHAGQMPKDIARAFGTKWRRDTAGGTVTWQMEEPKLTGIKLSLWDTEKIEAEKEIAL